MPAAARSRKRQANIHASVSIDALTGGAKAHVANVSFYRRAFRFSSDSAPCLSPSVVHIVTYSLHVSNKITKFFDSRTLLLI